MTIILLLVAAVLVFAAFAHDATPEEREFRGTFVMGDTLHGHIYQTEKESQPI